MVHFIARLWGQPKQTFVSDVDTPSGSLEETEKKLEWMDVHIDLTKTDPSRYDAVILYANYTSVRSRYFEAPEILRSMNASRGWPITWPSTASPWKRASA